MMLPAPLRITVASLLILAAMLSITSCGGKKSALVYGIKWTGLIRTPLVPIYQAPGNPPYTVKEDLKFSGGFGEISGDISKYNFAIESSYLTVTNDKPKAGSGETWNDIWQVYSDSGVKSDGSREVYIKGRCYLKSKKLNPVHPVGSLDFDLRLVAVPNKPFHFVMNVKTTKQGTASDLQISGNATPPDGVITFLP